MLDPSKQHILHFVTLSVQVWESEEAASLDLVPVVSGPIFLGDLAPLVIVTLCIVKRHDFTKIKAIGDITNMVENDIYHDSDPKLMRFLYEALKVFLSPKVWIDSVDVLSPVSMVAKVCVFDKRRNVDGIKAKGLMDVRQDGLYLME